MSVYPSISWLAVIDSWDGPDSLTSPGNGNGDCISGTAQLNSYRNVQTIGYVHTGYATTNINSCKLTSLARKNWAIYTLSNIGIEGILFDKSAGNYTYMSETSLLSS
jgi:hypothetical protein